MKFTARLTHLDAFRVQTGDRPHYKDEIAVYGNTGFSTGPHLHISVVEGHYEDFTMLGIENGHFKSNEQALYRLVSNTLMNGAYRITTRYLEPGYKKRFSGGQYEHWGVDVVSLLDTRLLRWSSHSQGRVAKRSYNSMAGNYLVIQYTDDITGHWAEDAMKMMIEQGRMSGYPDGTFKPNGNITRAEYAQAEMKKR